MAQSEVPWVFELLPSYSLNTDENLQWWWPSKHGLCILNNPDNATATLTLAENNILRPHWTSAGMGVRNASRFWMPTVDTPPFPEARIDRCWGKLGKQRSDTLGSPLLAPHLIKVSAIRGSHFVNSHCVQKLQSLLAITETQVSFLASGS